MKCCVAIGMAVLVVVVGCRQRKFTIDMQQLPDGSVQRTVTIWAEDNGQLEKLTDAEVSVLREIYGEPIGDDEKKLTFRRTFARELPADIEHENLRNFGRLDLLRSPLGTVAAYVERMPGREMLEIARQGQQVIDLGIRALVAYADRLPELRADPDASTRVRDFLQTELRNDVLNVALMGWFETSGNTSERAPADLMFRVKSYMLEHGYLDAIDLDETDLIGQFARGAARKLARRLGHAEDPLPPVLARLDSMQAIGKILREGLTALGISEEEATEQLSPLMPGRFSITTPAGQVTWREMPRPVATNGAWSESDQAILWDARPTSGCELPQLLYAIWSQPDESFQRVHFGRVVLCGDPLSRFNTWYAGLMPRHRRVWDELLTSLRPGPDLTDRLKAFRFERPESELKAASQRADDTPLGAQLLLEKLTAEQP